jgi:hypothetical protein
VDNAQVTATDNTFAGPGHNDALTTQPATGIQILAGAGGTLRGNTVSGFLPEGSCGLVLPASSPAALHIEDTRFPAPGNWRGTCFEAGPATPVPAN